MRHVLDLPLLYEQPDAETLLQILDDLIIRPTTFEGQTGESEDDTAVAEAGIPRYLTSIIRSTLGWIDDDAVKEQIWDQASKRISERSGRTAQPSFRRTFTIPNGDDAVEVQLLEPSMTGDNLGHKTWASAYLLAKRLPSLMESIPSFVRQSSSGSHDEGLLPRVLELGAGTGLTGLALSLLAPCIIHLTDLPEIVPNLALNVSLNKPAIQRRQPLSSASSFGLDWSDLPRNDVPVHEKYDLLIAGDPLYSPEHPALVVEAIAKYLRRTPGSRVVIELPLREAYAKEREAMTTGLEKKGILLIQSGEDRGYDDWGGGATEVLCWWGLWGWQAS